MSNADSSVPYGYCHCGCGEETNLAPFTLNKKGQKKGEPMRFLWGHNLRLRYPQAKANAKHCPRCRTFKSLDSFYKNKAASDGLATYCKLCHSVVMAEHRASARGRETYQNYYQANKEQSRAKKREWYLNNKEYHKAYNRQWTAKNQDKQTAYANAHRAFKANAQGSHTLQEFRDLREAQRWACAYCAKELCAKTATRDHFIPLHSGGSDSIDNIVAVCRSCNASKHRLFFEQWWPILAQRLGFRTVTR